MTTTNQPTNKNKLVDKSNGWVEEFENEPLYIYNPQGTYLDTEKVKQFIQTQINKAVKEERMRFVEMLEDEPLNNKLGLEGCAKRDISKRRNELRQELRTKLKDK